MTIRIEQDSFEDIVNPIDSVEEVLSSNNWVFNRMNDDELMVQVQGRACEYRLYFIWQEDMNALQFCCQLETPVARDNYENAARSILSMNEKLWMGHFDLPQESLIPSFRHTCLLHGVSRCASSEQIQDLVQISLAQCERYAPLFSMLADNGNAIDEQNLQLALMESAGHS
jgi:hypothetical protein